MQAGRVAAAVCAAALGVAACGSSGSKTATTKTAGGAPVGQRGDAVLTGAYTKAVAAKSAHITLTGTVKTAGKTVDLNANGAFDWAQRLGDLTLQVPASGQTTTLTEVLDGTSVYIQLPSAAASELGKPWLKIDLSGLESSGESGDPAQTLAVLEASSDQVTDLGPQTIDGVATTHYRAQVDPTKEAASAPPAAKQLLQQLPSLTGSSTLPVDVWIDSQGLPRQLSYSFTLQKPPSGTSGAAAQAFPETTQLTMGLSDYGAPVTVTVPPSDQVSTQTVPGLPGGS